MKIAQETFVTLHEDEELGWYWILRSRGKVIKELAQSDRFHPSQSECLEECKLIAEGLPGITLNVCIPDDATEERVISEVHPIAHRAFERKIVGIDI